MEAGCWLSREQTLHRIPAVERAVPLLRGRGAGPPSHQNSAVDLKKAAGRGGSRSAPPGAARNLPSLFARLLRRPRCPPPLRARSQWKGQRNRLLPSLRGRARCRRERDPGSVPPSRPEGSTRAGVRWLRPQPRLCQGVKPAVRAGLLRSHPQSEHLQVASGSRRLKDAGWGLLPLKCW
ncbi:uncharacterized protein ACIB01_016879 [Guaruba guarouba]